MKKYRTTEHINGIFNGHTIVIPQGWIIRVIGGKNGKWIVLDHHDLRITIDESEFEHLEEIPKRLLH